MSNWEDIPRHAYALAKANGGAPGVDGEGFADIESGGLEEWLNGLRKDLHDKTYLEPNAYGYGPGKSAQDAIQKVDELLRAGYTDIVDADLSKYFDTIPHSEPMQCVARRIVDGQVAHPIKMWLQVPVEEREAAANGRKGE